MLSVNVTSENQGSSIYLMVSFSGNRIDEHLINCILT